MKISQVSQIHDSANVSSVNIKLIRVLVLTSFKAEPKLKVKITKFYYHCMKLKVQSIKIIVSEPNGSNVYSRCSYLVFSKALIKAL